MQLSAVVRKEGKLYISWCPELDVASQGKTIEGALSNLKEAVEFYLEDEDALAVEGARGGLGATRLNPGSNG